jgi:hypothetical protein
VPLLKHCQFCGAQSTTLEAYYQWMVCGDCVATLRGTQSARASAEEPQPRRSTRRTRCKWCGELHEQEHLRVFYGDHINNETHKHAYGKRLCDDCHAKMWTPCAVCGRHGAFYIPPIPPHDKRWCSACFIRITSEMLGRADAARGQRHARILAEHAGERLEWPCSMDDLKRVWRSAARRTHPDTGGSSEAFRAANESYRALLNLAEVAR